jgi:class 3 adenylate cyclase/tetratricopeptide (TPR) repeat protein
MSSTLETRKLAAVVFADIEGYTALFQRDEAAAMRQVQLHRKGLEEISGRFHGQIIQFYGDGSVTIFTSVIDAIQSSIALQQLSMQQAIPIRIGIHMGDLVYKDNDIFGDVVNVTSRIQSAGIAGSILVSKKVADELKNHPEIKFQPIGKFSLKNVGEELDLFALTGSGLKVPPVHKSIKKNTFYSTRTYIFLLVLVSLAGLLVIPRLKQSALEKFTTERLGILPFENLTPNPELDRVSMQTFVWLTKVLSEFAEPNKIMQSRSAMLYTNGDLSLFKKDPSLFRKTGCIYQLTGSFNPWGVNNDSLEFNAAVYDVRTDEAVIHLQKVYCAADSPWDGIRQVADVIKGYWKGKDQKLLSYPKNDALDAYTNAILKWGGPEEDEARPDLIKAIHLDSTFLDPYFLLLDMFYNKGEPSNALDTLKLIHSRFKDLDERQKNYLRYHEEDIEGRRTSAWKYFLNEWRNDSIDLMYTTSGMVMGIEYLNDPVTTLMIGASNAEDTLSLLTCDYCRTRLLQAMKAHVALSQFEQAGALADRVRLLVRRPGEYMALIHYYMAVKDTSSTNTLIFSIENDTISSRALKSYLNLIAGREAMLQGNIPLRNYYADRAIKAMKGESGRPMARAFALKDDLDMALRIYEKTWQEIADDGRQTMALGEMGVLYARKKQVEKANEIITTLERRKKRFDYGEIPYMQGKIKAHLGDSASAVAYLSKSLDEGRLFQTGISFQYDPDLMILNSDPGYKKLLDRNKQL